MRGKRAKALKTPFLGKGLIIGTSYFGADSATKKILFVTPQPPLKTYLQEMWHQS
jgi:hypothetical protein